MDYRKLVAWQKSMELAEAVYIHTAEFPLEERYGLTAQIRKSAVSIPSNKVEGCARETQADYLRFLGMAYGSARELEYPISLAVRLGFLPAHSSDEPAEDSLETCKVLNGLIKALRVPIGG